MSKIKTQILSYALKLFDNDLAGSNASCISIKLDTDIMYITKTDVKLNKLTNKDVIKVDLNNVENCTNNIKEEVLLHKSIYQKHKNANCIMHTSPVNSNTIATAGVTIPPILDDMAQIIGPTARTAKQNNIKSILKALKNRNACFIPNNGMIAFGRTLDEAYTACLVLEKAAHTFIWAEAVGGCKPVGMIGAYLECLVYRKKYSKINQDTLLKAERE